MVDSGCLLTRLSFRLVYPSKYSAPCRGTDDPLQSPIGAGDAHSFLSLEYPRGYARTRSGQESCGEISLCYTFVDEALLLSK